MDLVANTSIIVAVYLTVRAADDCYLACYLGTSRCERTLISICTNYFVARCETLIRNGKPVGAPIEAMGSPTCLSFILFLSVSMAQKQYWFTPMVYPFFTRFSGHNRTLRDTEGHKKTSVFIERLRIC
jgi:hypothetical protein